MNSTFKEIITTKGKNHQRVKQEFELEFCDQALKSDTDIKSYCNEKHIPFENNE
ncbi:MAG: hypothetical protein K0U38_01020 [Epsilonproteobacteria bacterium]|nr:hypothetical protein [Campylobacterota bacterium]